MRPARSIALSTVAVLSNPLRYAFDQSAQAATQFAGTFDPDKPPVADDEEPGLEGKDFYSPTQATFANGMHAAIVETDPVTAEIRILRYCVVHDCGVMVNPMIVEGQVHGGVAQGVGGALYERMAYDESGQLLNASFMDFLMPYASEVPHIETDHLETPSPLNPLGLKGAGRGRHHPGLAPSSPPPSRMPRGSRSARCRSARPSSGSCASSTRRPPTPFPRRKVRDEDLRQLHARGPGRQGLGGDPGPGRARPLHARLRVARRHRRGPLRHVGHRRRRGHQGHVRR